MYVRLCDGIRAGRTRRTDPSGTDLTKNRG